MLDLEAYLAGLAKFGMVIHELYPHLSKVKVSEISKELVAACRELAFDHEGEESWQ